MTEILSWPVDNDFPQEILLDNGERFNNTKIETEMESGLPHARRRDTVNFSTFTAQIFLDTSEQREMFKRFWNEETKHGSVPFSWHDPLTGVEGTYMIVEITSLSPLGGGAHLAGFVMREVPR
jgi:hypothetical protein